MHVRIADDPVQWDSFVQSGRYTPFLQSWTMGEVYRDVGQEPVRLLAESDGEITGVCQAILVPARRGRHLMIQYGPLVRRDDAIAPLLQAICDAARDAGCSFVRMSPFHTDTTPLPIEPDFRAIPAPLHLLSEHMWYLPLRTRDRWQETGEAGEAGESVTREFLLQHMRQTTRNPTRRAEREGVEVTVSSNPEIDLDIYFALEQETYRRHGFVPYPSKFIRAQVKHFAPHKQALVYIARYNGEPLAASVHMSFGGETSYHHGASTHAHPKIPASTLLQWTAIGDALDRGDAIYSFWGIAPRQLGSDGTPLPVDRRHPFAGVTTFKTGFGGCQLDLMHCTDLPLSATYRLTRAFEFARKWKRGF